MVNNDFYKNKSILVTGGNGFIGSHLVEKLIKIYAKVYVISHSKELNNINKIKDKLEQVFFYDITKKDEVEKIKDNFDIIFHLAANVSVNNSIKNPKKTRKTNVIGTKNILDLAVRNKVKKFVYVSTGLIYKWSDKPIKEEGKQKPLNPYGKTKLEGENLCIEYGKKFSLNIVIPRFFTTYGPKQKEGVVMLFIKKVLNNENIVIEGDGKQKRDFINVKDVVNALLIVGSEKPANNQIINFGASIGTEIVTLAEKIIKISNSSSKIIHITARKNDGSYICDYSKAKKLLGWEPKIMLDEGLKEMIEWAKGGFYNG